MAHKPLTHTLTRDQLYALVWQTSVATLAKQFGVSGRGLLARSCRRLHVPVPPRGYWARRAAGQTVTSAVACNIFILLRQAIERGGLPQTATCREPWSLRCAG